MKLRGSSLWLPIVCASMILWMGCSGDGGGDDDGTSISTPTPWNGGESPTPVDTPTGTPNGTPTFTPVPTQSPTPPIEHDQDGDGVSLEQGDCDDTDPNTYPGAPEIGDGLDNNCNGEVDEGLDTVDHDGDGYSPKTGDCDDTNGDIHPGAVEVPYDGIDQDCQGGDLIDVDGDGYSGAPGPGGTEPADCNDGDSSIHPSGTEVPYDGVDQDCDGADLTDVDGDGVPGGSSGADCDDTDAGRSPNLTEVPYDGIDQDCTGSDLTDVDGDGQAAEQVGGDDCDDNDATAYKGADEVPYDGIDQDCDGEDLTDVDGDGYNGGPGGDDCDDHDIGTYPGALEYADGKDNDCDGTIDNHIDTSDDDGDSYAESDGDCNDASSAIYPGATEVPYDGIDQDCDGNDLTDVDGDGFKGAAAGGADCDDKNSSINPDATEVAYDGIDQDCSGSDLTDVDGDGFDAVQVGGADCDDSSPLINPNASETPYDGIDQDCSGADLTDVDGDGYDATAVSGGSDCNDASSSINPGASEVCDGIDNNCDNVVDSDAVDRSTFYVDGDHDGYGDPNQPVLSCTQTGSLVTDNTDCDDSSSQNHPGATEVCDTKDNNCDGKVDEGVTTTFYQDADGDGYGNSKVTIQACSVPAGYSANSTDCDDANKTVYPSASELCDGLDNDCDTQVDEGVKTTFYQDNDADGYGNPAKSVQACSAPAGYVADNTDCKDTNDQIHPGATEVCDGIDNNCDGQVDEGVKGTWYLDNDKDGYGDPAKSTQACSQPAGYVSKGTDCDDTNASINPGALEACNGIDDDCDAQIDEGVKTTFYQDQDKDGYGNPAVSQQACTAPTGYVKDNTDCKDTNDLIHPGAVEACNGVDDDCDSQIDEGVKTTYYRDADQDGYGDATQSSQACSVPSGYVTNSFDCDDTKAGVNPAAVESCNGVDDNCNGQTDENVTLTWYQDADHDNYGNAAVSSKACTAPTGYVSNSTDCDDTKSSVHPGATETCNGIDDNCTGGIDEGVKTTYYQDLDGDGYGNASVSTQACSAPTGYVTDNTDCKDTNDTIHPNATEIANGVDDNCNGSIDEGVSYATCKQIKQYIPGSPSGVYTIDVDGTAGSSAPFQVYCDMTTDNGGWTLVLLNSPYPTPPKPSYSAVVGNVNITGTFGADLTKFDLFLGLKYWNSLGSTMRLTMGNSPSSLAHVAFYNFVLDESNHYALGLSAESVTVNTSGTASSGMYTYHNTRPMTTFDSDNDAYGANCANSYGNTAWWYGACWSGSFWGGGDSGSYTNNPYWTSSGGEYWSWGAIWLR